MTIASTQATQALQAAVASKDPERAKLQMALLKKVLEMQQDQAAELQKLAEPKGKVIDIRC